MRRGVLAAAGAFLAAACAAAGPGAPTPGEVPGIEGRDCRYLPAPDEARVARVLDVVAGQQVPDAVGPLTLSVRYGPEGTVDWVRPIGLFTSEAQEVGRRMASAVEQEAEAAWGYRLRVAPDARPRVLPGIACEAELPSGVRLLSGPLPPGVRLPTRAGSWSLSVSVTVAPDGTPRDPRVRVPPELSGLHAHLADAALSHRYLPALHDGFAVEGTFEYESELRARVTRVR